MFNKSICIASTVSAALLVGCVPAPYKLSPKQVPTAPPSTSSFFVSDALPSSTQPYAQTYLKGTYFTVSGASRGLNDVGVLLGGLLYVTANAAYVNSVNRERAVPLAGLTSQNLSKILSQELSTARDKNDRSSISYKVTPDARIFFKSDNAYWLGCTVTVELPQANGAKPWSARYAIPVEGVFDSSNTNDTTKASSALGPCLRSAYELFEEHIAGKLGAFEARTITTREFGTVIETQAQVAVSRLPGKVLVNNIWGVAEWRVSEITQIK